MPPDERHRDVQDFDAPFAGRGPAAQIGEFSQPLVDAAGDSPAAINNALQLGMLFWNMGVAAEHDCDDLVREQLVKLEDESRRVGNDAREFRAIAAMMLKRYAEVRPNSGASLMRIIEVLWGRDLSAAAPRIGRVAWIVDAVKCVFTKK